MDYGVVLNTLRDPAGIPFYPVVFQALYVLTWALHYAFVGLAMGAMGLSLLGLGKQKTDENWKILVPHLIQTGKISVSILIVLGVAPLLFTQVIYDPNWYVVNSISGLWVFVFIYALMIGYSLYYGYYYANKAGSSATGLVGWISFLLLLFCGIIMHALSNEAIQPEKWLEWYAPGGKIDHSGTVFVTDPFRLGFMIALSLPVLGIFLLNYRDYVSKRDDFSKSYLDFVGNMGKKIAIVGLLISAVFFVLWMLNQNALFSVPSLLTIVSVLVLLMMVAKDSNSYLTTGVLVVAALLVSAVREYLRYRLMVDLGYNIYDYKVNLEIPTTLMFFATFVGLGFSAVSFMLMLAWKAGRTKGVFDASKDKTITLLGNTTLTVLVAWLVIFMLWGMFHLFKNTL